jgi:hypothetical protein
MATCIFLDGVTPTTKHGGLTYTPQRKGLQIDPTAPVTVLTYKGKVKPLVQWTPVQNDARLAVSAAAVNWATLSSGVQDTWTLLNPLPAGQQYARYSALNTLLYQWGLPFIDSYPGYYPLGDGVTVRAGYDASIGQEQFQVANIIEGADAIDKYVHIYLQLSGCGYQVVTGFVPPDHKELISPPPRASGYVYIGTIGPIDAIGFYNVPVGNDLSTIIGFTPIPFAYDVVPLCYSGGGMQFKWYVTDATGIPFITPHTEATSQDVVQINYSFEWWYDPPWVPGMGLAARTGALWAPGGALVRPLARAAREAALGRALGKWGT